MRCSVNSFWNHIWLIATSSTANAVPLPLKGKAVGAMAERYCYSDANSCLMNLAIAEWPTSSAVGQKGFADYALFVGEKLVAIIEAKAMYKDIPSVLDYQCKDYARIDKIFAGQLEKIVAELNEYLYDDGGSAA